MTVLKGYPDNEYDYEKYTELELQDIDRFLKGQYNEDMNALFVYWAQKGYIKCVDPAEWSINQNLD